MQKNKKKINYIENALIYKYFDFKTRASRIEFFMFTMFKKFSLDFVRQSGNFLFYGIIFLILLCPSYAVTVRRFHDMNLSGWWVLLLEICVGTLTYIFFKEDYFVIFLISLILVLMLSLIPGSKGKNKYGELEK